MAQDVSISIISMNNEQLLTNCLDSIKENTIRSRYEIYVLAYLFEKRSLDRLKQKYSDVSFVENDEITGFAENHNIILRKTTGKYVLVLNDDVYFTHNIIDGLVDSIERLDDNVAFISPVLKYPSGQIQFNGREKYTILDYVLVKLHLEKLIKFKPKYSNQCGIYRSYNVTGACFLAKNSVFQELGYFNDDYFFCPEDIALSTKANNLGFRVFVDTNLYIYHIHEASSTSLKPATGTVETLGLIEFLGTNLITRSFLQVFTLIQLMLKLVYLNIFRKRANYEGERKLIIWTMEYLFTKRSIKEVFITLYKRIKLSQVAK